MNKEFFTSDWHIGHFNTIKFDKRPFKGLDDMHAGLIRRFNSAVSEDCVTYFLGDTGVHPETIKKVMDCLNGKKILVLGNHDRNRATMLNAGFDAVVNSLSFYIGDTLVTASHCPLLGVFREDMSHITREHDYINWWGDTSPKYAKYTVPDVGQFHLHGHIHSTPENGKLTRTNRQFDVGVAGNDYRPVSMGEVVRWVQSEVSR